MVSRLERWKKDARRHGFAQEADLIGNQAEVFRRAGVPEDFPQSEQPQELKDIKDIRARLVKAMSQVSSEETLSFIESSIDPRLELIKKLAEAINQVGKYVADEVTFKELDFTYICSSSPQRGSV